MRTSPIEGTVTGMRWEHVQGISHFWITLRDTLDETRELEVANDLDEVGDVGGIPKIEFYWHVWGTLTETEPSDRGRLPPRIKIERTKSVHGTVFEWRS